MVFLGSSIQWDNQLNLHLQFDTQLEAQFSLVLNQRRLVSHGFARR